MICQLIFSSVIKINTVKIPDLLLQERRHTSSLLNLICVLLKRIPLVSLANNQWICAYKLVFHCWAVISREWNRRCMGMKFQVLPNRLMDFDEVMMIKIENRIIVHLKSIDGCHN